MFTFYNIPDRAQQLFAIGTRRPYLRAMGEAFYPMATPRAVALHGASGATIRAMAERIVRTGFADSQKDLAARFDLSLGAVVRILAEAKFTQLVSHLASVRLHTEGKPAAIGTLLHVVKDETARHSDRLRAAEIILSRTTPPAAASSSDGPERDLAEMTAEELRQVVDAMKSELANRSEPLSAPDSTPKQIDLTPDPPHNPFD